MDKGGKRLRNASKGIKDLQAYNHEFQNQIKEIEWDLQQRQNIINHMVDTLQLTNNLQSKVNMKDQLIGELQIKLIEEKDQLDERTSTTKIDAICDKQALLEKIDAKNDIEDLIQKFYVACEIVKNLPWKLVEMVYH